MNLRNALRSTAWSVVSAASLGLTLLGGCVACAIPETASSNEIPEGAEGANIEVPLPPPGGWGDHDLDGRNDNADNCPLVPNFLELAEDADGDGLGNGCDAPADTGIEGGAAGCEGLPSGLPMDLCGVPALGRLGTIARTLAASGNTRWVAAANELFNAPFITVPDENGVPSPAMLFDRPASPRVIEPALAFFDALRRAVAALGTAGSSATYAANIAKVAGDAAKYWQVRLELAPPTIHNAGLQAAFTTMLGGARTAYQGGDSALGTLSGGAKAVSISSSLKAADTAIGAYRSSFVQFVRAIELLGAASQTTIGARGGTVWSTDGLLQLEIQAGALAGATTFTVRRRSDEALATSVLPVGLRSEVWEIEPAGLALAQPATLTISTVLDPYEDSSVGPALIMFDPTDGVEGGAVAATHVREDHFSTYRAEIVQLPSASIAAGMVPTGNGPEVAGDVAGDVAGETGETGESGTPRDGPAENRCDLNFPPRLNDAGCKVNLINLATNDPQAIAALCRQYCQMCGGQDYCGEYEVDTRVRSRGGETGELITYRQVHLVNTVGVELPDGTISTIWFGGSVAHTLVGYMLKPPSIGPMLIGKGILTAGSLVGLLKDDTFALCVNQPQVVEQCNDRDMCPTSGYEHQMVWFDEGNTIVNQEWRVVDNLTPNKALFYAADFRCNGRLGDRCAPPSKYGASRCMDEGYPMDPNPSMCELDRDISAVCHRLRGTVTCPPGGSATECHLGVETAGPGPGGEVCDLHYANSKTHTYKLVEDVRPCSFKPAPVDFGQVEIFAEAECDDVPGSPVENAYGFADEWKTCGDAGNTEVSWTQPHRTEQYPDVVIGLERVGIPGVRGRAPLPATLVPLYQDGVYVQSAFSSSACTASSCTGSCPPVPPGPAAQPERVDGAHCVTTGCPDGSPGWTITWAQECL